MGEIDDMLHQAKNSEEKAKKAMVDAARLADELRAEQDHTGSLSKTKRALESQLSELENKAADANEAAVRGGRAALAKLETRIRELEIELGNSQAHTAENMKGYQKTERRCKELQFQIDEDKKNQDRWILLNIRTQEMIFDGDLAMELDFDTAYLEYHRMLDAHPFNFVLLLLFSTS